MNGDDYVQKYIKGYLKIKNKHCLHDFEPQVIIALRKEFDTWTYLTVAECMIWLGLSVHTIHRMIKSGKIVAIKFTGRKGCPYKINVAETKKSLGLK